MRETCAAEELIRFLRGPRKITVLELASLVSKETGLKRSYVYDVLNTALILMEDVGLELTEENDDKD